MSQNSNLLPIVIIVVLVIGAIGAYSWYQSLPKIAELTVKKMKDNSADVPLKKDQTIILRASIKNISNNTISNVVVKTTIEPSDVEILRVDDTEKEYLGSITPGNEGAVDIHITIANVITTTATQDVSLQLFVNNQPEDSPEIVTLYLAK